MQEIIINNGITLGEYLEHIKITFDALTAAAWVLVALGCLAMVLLYIILDNKE